MRRMQSVMVWIGFIAATGMGHLMGCSNDADDCALNATCNRNGTPFKDEVPPPLPGCTDSPSTNSEVIRDDCGWFVGGANATDNNPGTEAAPFKSLQAAITVAKVSKARVYLCGTFNEPVDIPAGVSIFGAFDCSGSEWSYDATKRASIAPPAPAKPEDQQASVKISGLGSSRFEDVNIRAANATFEGGSSIALLVDKTLVDLTRVDLVAGDGFVGTTGKASTNDVGPSTSTDPAIAGNAGIMACSNGSGINMGAAAKINALCAASVGGAGGSGSEMSGQTGVTGTPTLAAGTGVGGIGAAGMTLCKAGADGSKGLDGLPGIGAMGLGSLDPIKGYVGTSGSAGEPGSPGQGGGGGGGAKGKMGCGGASAGSGGAGGCPGLGGTGGGPGGSSIGIIAIGATLSWQSVTIVTGMGGPGGTGGDGAIGGVGGIGGKGGQAVSMTVAGCDGGKGGDGGIGGTGGGGHGGHSLGIAFTGMNAPSSIGPSITIGDAGMGGPGGDASGTGESGIQNPIQSFP